MAKRPTPRGRQPDEARGRPRRRSARACMMTSRAALRTLGVAVTPEMLDAALSAAEKESLSHLEFLHRLLAGPAEARLQRALERRIRAAKFRELTTLEGFDWEFNAKGVDRRTHRATGDLRLRAPARERDPGGPDRPGQEPDPPGGGPRRVRPGLPRAVRDQRQAAPGIHRGAGRRDLTTGCSLSTRGSTCLLIDEFGFDRLEREAQAQASTFYYRLLDARTGRRSTALATNIDFTAWADYLGDPPLATAFLDRLVDGAVILKLTGRSYRAHRARPVVEADAAD